MKQAIVARADLGMGEGKLAAQVAHASLQAYKEADGEADLFELADRAERDGLPHAVVRDAGHTQLKPGTVTTLAVGPAPDDGVDAITGDLQLY